MALTVRGRPLTPKVVADALVSRANLYFLHPVVGQLPRMVWGNDAGIRGNVRGRAEIADAQRAWRDAHGGSSPPPTPDADHAKAEGYAAFDPEYEAGAFERVHRSYHELIANDAGSRWNGIGAFKQASRAINQAAKNLDGVQGLITPKVQRTFEAYYGGYFQVTEIRAWRTRHVEGLDERSEAYSNQWHNDRFPISLMRLFVYLSDGVTRDTGAFRLHPISHTSEIVRSGYLQRSIILPKARRMLDDESKIVYFEGNAGAACMANVQLCLHRAGVPRAGYERDILQFTLRPSKKPLAKNWVEDIPYDPL